MPNFLAAVAVQGLSRRHGTAALSTRDALAWLRGLLPVLIRSRAGLGRDRTHPAANRAMQLPGCRDRRACYGGGPAILSLCTAKRRMRGRHFSHFITEYLAKLPQHRSRLAVAAFERSWAAFL